LSSRRTTWDGSATKNTTFDDVLKDTRCKAENAKDLGTRFEKITKDFLEADSRYKNRFAKVYMWNSWKYRATVSASGEDVGVDLVAEEKDGSWCAIQCKCYADNGTIDYKKLSTFFSTSKMIADRHKKKVNMILVYTGDRISPQADKAIKLNECHVIGQDEFRNSNIIWNDFPKLKVRKPKDLREHQIRALNDVIAGLEKADRGKMIMACGTGKTLTALRIAEKHVGVGGTVLYLVPSISLIHQTLREWSENATLKHHYAVACSDRTVGNAGEEEEGGGDISELPFPPTTNAEELRRTLDAGPPDAMAVVFSTYHSIAAASKSMRDKPFDLVLCDEAHRTTGAEKEKSKNLTHFTQVHHEHHIKARKRLYMTATPRVYGEVVKQKAEVHSMDDPTIYGEDLHVYSFPDAVDDEQLADFKVRIPVIPEEDLQKYTDEAIEGEGKEGTIDERVLLAAVWHGLNYDGEKKCPLLQRVISFSNKIEASRQFAGKYEGEAPTQDEESYIHRLQKGKKEDESRIDADRSFVGTVQKYESGDSKTGNTVSVRHMDGSMRASIRGNKIRWLKDSEQKPGECRILSNARCLSEGVDVPSLDGVIFLQPRKSKTDVIQAVGRVMRKSPGKDYGYVILPVVIPSGTSVEVSLHDKKVWQTVWQVLAALRSHNPNFASEINRVNLDRNHNGHPSKLETVEIVWMGSHHTKATEHEMFGKLLTRMVEKVGERSYFEGRSRELGHKARELRDILHNAYGRRNARVVEVVDDLRDGLRHIVNDSVDRDSTIDVLAQHHALSQVFDALFPKEFRTANDVAKALDAGIKNIGLHKELEKFDRFYEDVRKEAAKFQHTKGKQDYIKKIYGSFLLGFDKLEQEEHGIVYTPDEVIDFIIHSTEYILRTEFETGFSNKDVKIFDPATGTGAFITRLLGSNLITKDRLLGKYGCDIWANEINLLAYYVASVNIESVFGEMSGTGKHEPFRNINYTDTLNHSPHYRLETRHRHKITTLRGGLKRISDNIERGNWSRIHVIMGNPPYSVGQDDYNKQRSRKKYPKLDVRINDTYVRSVKKINKEIQQPRSLYDSYIRFVRWASDRIENSGVVAFITNAGFLRTEAGAGVRACLGEEFSDVWCFDLRGNQRTQGEMSKREGGKIFGESSRAPVAITILVKNPKKHGCTIHYKNIGDCLPKTRKLEIIKNARSIGGIKNWETIKPDKYHDWLDQRNEEFEIYTPIGSKTVKSGKAGESIFGNYSHGVKTSRDRWAYNPSDSELAKNMERHISYCNKQNPNNPKIDPKCAKWTRDLKSKLSKTKPPFDKSNIRRALYRPFFKQHVYFDKTYNNLAGITPKAFPSNDSENLVICVPYKFTGEFSVFATDTTPDIQLNFNGQCFPLYIYQNGSKKENITERILHKYRKYYNNYEISSKDIFYYVYGMLHHPEYRKKFINNLTRELPRIPMASNFAAFRNTGKKLVHLHVNFETCKKHNLGSPKFNPTQFKKLTLKMPKRAKKHQTSDRASILADGQILFDNVPETEYRVNGKTPIGWIIDRYQVEEDKNSGITKDPCTGTDIVAVLERAIHVGLESDRLISKLPKEFEPEEGRKPRRMRLEEFNEQSRSTLS